MTLNEVQYHFHVCASRIDIRDFTTQYSAYSVELEGRLADKV